MNKSLSKLLAPGLWALPLMAVTAFCPAQELSLFEEVDSGEEDNRPVRVQTRQEASSGTPAYTLRSASRFGDTYRSVLLDAEGKPVTLNWQVGQQVTVPGSNGYMVTGIENGKLTLLHPGSARCIDSQSAGVACLDSATALLSLRPAAPLASNAGSTSGQEEGRSGAGRDAQATAIDRAERRRQAIAARFRNSDSVIRTDSGNVVLFDSDGEGVESARVFFSDSVDFEQGEQQSRFEPVRISEEDAPPGMRVVRTPFGDRLVPIRQ